MINKCINYKNRCLHLPTLGMKKFRGRSGRLSQRWIFFRFHPLWSFSAHFIECSLRRISSIFPWNMLLPKKVWNMEVCVGGSTRRLQDGTTLFKWQYCRNFGVSYIDTSRLIRSILKETCCQYGGFQKTHISALNIYSVNQMTQIFTNFVTRSNLC